MRRLVKECVDFAFTQQLGQFGQRALQDAVLLFQLFGRLRVLAGVERNFVIGGIVLFRNHQIALGASQQFGDAGAAADVIGVHHVTNTGTVQRVASLQQVDPAFVQLGLLLANGLQNGEVFFVILQ
ncbi:hypothetical protein D3C72_1156000 [compost metagenome]